MASTVWKVFNTIDLTDPIVSKIKENSNKVENKNQYLFGYKLETKYYAIEKTLDHLKGKKGQYLGMHIYMHGIYDIVNTKENEGNSKALIACLTVGLLL